MSITIGTITVNLFSTDKDETVYITEEHTLSHTDNVSLKRTLPRNSTGALRTNLRFERGFPVMVNAVPVEKPVTVSIAVTAPVGVNATSVHDYIAECLLQGSSTAAKLGTTGDIHLDA